MSGEQTKLRFAAQSFVPHDVGHVFAWHERPGAFARLSPPWENVEVLSRKGTILDGDTTVLRVQAGPIRTEWEARHFDYRAGVQFKDEQVRGPFSSWVQEHRFTAIEEGTRVEDLVDYRLPGGALGRSWGRNTVERKLQRLFGYRYRALAADLQRHARYKGPPLRVLVAGASGLVGSALCAFLSTGGHEVLRLVRAASHPAADAVGTPFVWDPQGRKLDVAALGRVDAVVNLAGENVGAGRWTATRKQQMWTSRVDLTQFLVEMITNMSPRPRVLVNASAMGFYGDRGEEVINEASAPGQGYLPDLCQGWEASATKAKAAGVRVVLPRIGLVLSPRDGVLSKMLPAFRAGVGGKLGSGQQWMSWIVLDDLVGLLHRALTDDSLEGPINAAAPGAVRNKDFATALGDVLGRAAVLPVPGAALKLLFGEMGALALASTHMRPQRLLDVGFPFQFEELTPALTHILGRDALPPLERVDDVASVDYRVS